MSEVRVGEWLQAWAETQACPLGLVKENDCWDEQERMADIDFHCPMHGDPRDTFERLGIDVL